ncbi:MAG: LamG domain-containing protein, partial [Phycisphaerales bacterium]
MCRRSVHLLSFTLALTLILTGATRADLVGWWRFDEGSGDTATDSSGNNHHGTLLGTPEWGVGAKGSAVVFNPDGCYGIDCGVFDPTDGTGQFTLALWAFWDGTGTYQHFLSKSNAYGASTMMFQVELWAAHSSATYTDRVGVTYQGAPQGSVPFFIMPKNEWVHLAFTFDGSELRVYLNGVDEMGPKPFSIGPNVDAQVEIGYTSTRPSNIYRTFEGRLDEVRIYSHALSPTEVLSAMTGEPWPWAFGPDPADGVLHLNTWANLSWSAGDFAVTHDVYLSDNFDDVNNGTGDSYRGNQGGTTLIIGFPSFPYPEGLVPGTTYYWRIDEVNDADPNSPWKGDVWSFSIPPKTAYYPNPADDAGYVDLNAELSWTAGYEAKLHTVYFSDNFDDVN